MKWADLTNNKEKLKAILPGIESGKSNTAIAKDFGISEKTIRTVIKKCGYKREGSRLVPLDITSSNTIVIEQVPNDEIPEDKPIIPSNNKEIAKANDEKINIIFNIFNDDNISKWMQLSENIDSILNLIPKHTNCIYKTNVNSVKSIRIDSGLYDEIKHRAERDNTTATELFNKALEEYLNNNL